MVTTWARFSYSYCNQTTKDSMTREFCRLFGLSVARQYGCAGTDIYQDGNNIGINLTVRCKRVLSVRERKERGEKEHVSSG